MPDSIGTALARVKSFRADWEDNGLIDESSDLTTEDLDAVAAALDWAVGSVTDNDSATSLRGH